MGAIGYEQRKAAKKAKKLAKQKAHQASIRDTRMAKEFMKQKKESRVKERIAKGPNIKGQHNANLVRNKRYKKAGVEFTSGNQNRTVAPEQYGGPYKKKKKY